MCKISIIIPVYNVAEYLNDVLNSILEQTFEDFEVICINDGSTDNSLEILETFATKDNRFKVISQPNQGQGVARNNGITLAKGEYLMFVDPDDYIEKNSLEIIYNKFQGTNVDVIQFDYTIVNSTQKQHKAKSFQQKIKQETNYNIKENDIFCWQKIPIKNLKCISLSVWDKAYKTDFIKNNNIKFAPNKYGEDHIFSISACLLANKELYLNQHFYNYCFRYDSSVNTVSNENFCVFENIKLIKDFLISNQKYEEYKTSFSEYMTSVLSWHYSNIPSRSINQYLEMCKTILTPNEYKIFLDKTNGEYTILEKIFSIKNRKRNGEKFKILTILGKEFKISKSNKEDI